MIHELLGKGVYRLRDGDNVLKQTANAANLKRYHEQVSPSSSPGSKKRVRKRTRIVDSSPSTPGTPVATPKAKLTTHTPSAVGVRQCILDTSAESSPKVAV